MAKWRRCTTCRKVLAEGEFEPGSDVCRADQAKVVAGSTAATTRPATVTTRVAPLVQRTAPHELRGRGDSEMRGRRARTRALERLAERHLEDYEFLLGEERAAEGL